MKEPWVKRVKINEKVGVLADFVTILEQFWNNVWGIGQGVRKTQGRFT